MCLAPNMLADGTLVACRYCQLCRENTIKDWAGRLIAESKTARYAYFALLTYGDDRLGDQGKIKAAVLTYSDVQKYFKRLRKLVGRMKYFIVGEYGGANGRAHWHAVLFTDVKIEETGTKEKEAPKVDGVLRTQGEWELGWSSYKPFHHKHAYYCCKYLFKDKHDDLKIAMHKMSKKPPIGHEYFMAQAERHVENGLAPQDLFYSFAEIKKRDGTPIKYMMRAKTAENFCEHFVEKWQEKYGYSEPGEKYVKYDLHYKPEEGAIRIPASPVIEEYLDKRMRKWIEIADAFEAHEEYRDVMERKAQNEQEEEQERAKYARKDTCSCPSCVARRRGDPDWYRVNT